MYLAMFIVEETMFCDLFYCRLFLLLFHVIQNNLLICVILFFSLNKATNIFILNFEKKLFPEFLLPTKYIWIKHIKKNNFDILVLKDNKPFFIPIEMVERIYKIIR
jgi:hypothetical protein